ncbi:radical SAM protein [Sphingomonas sp. ID0503]|uniref:SPL family radical SAM protein n=1 Tax=Sphingomonas sp. ID0503 TaxID=3399691 RepID=UPI003AFA530A
MTPPSKRRLQPIAPSADWRVDLAEGCSAHRSYCYLVGSLKGPPITRVYANLEEILAGLPAYLGQGSVTSRSRARSHEGTTFEASCYTDPLALEPLTGSLSAAIAWFGRWNADAQLHFTTKFADVAALLPLDHGGRTRMRASINPRAFARFEGGTAPVAARLSALRRMADAGYPVGLTIAPIIAAEGWETAYGELIEQAGIALDGVIDLDLTVELITHRFNPGSKAVLESWYPGSDLDMTGQNRATKRTKLGPRSRFMTRTPCAACGPSLKPGSPNAYRQRGSSTGHDGLFHVRHPLRGPSHNQPLEASFREHCRDGRSPHTALERGRLASGRGLAPRTSTSSTSG